MSEKGVGSVCVVYCFVSIETYLYVNRDRSIFQKRRRVRVRAILCARVREWANLSLSRSFSRSLARALSLSLSHSVSLSLSLALSRSLSLSLSRARSLWCINIDQPLDHRFLIRAPSSPNLPTPARASVLCLQLGRLLPRTCS